MQALQDAPGELEAVGVVLDAVTLAALWGWGTSKGGLTEQPRRTLQACEYDEGHVTGRGLDGRRPVGVSACSERHR